MSAMVPNSRAKTGYLAVAALKDSVQGRERKLLWCDMCSDTGTGVAIGPQKKGHLTASCGALKTSEMTLCQILQLCLYQNKTGNQGMDSSLLFWAVGTSTETKTKKELGIFQNCSKIIMGRTEG